MRGADYTGSIIRCFIVALLGAQLFVSTSVNAQSAQERQIAFDFNFSPGSTTLQTNFGNNSIELANLRDFIPYNKHGIQTGSSHFAIVSFVKEGSISDLYALNRASVLGSIVRAYLKTRYGFTNPNFTFIIRAENELADCVRLEYRPFSIKPTDNQDIHFALKPAYQDLISAMSKYGKLPLEAKEVYDPIIASVEEQQTQLISPPDLPPADDKPQPADTLPQIQPLLPEDSLPKIQILQPADTTESPHNNIDEHYIIIQSFRPIFGLRTNLLNIAGVTPPAKVVKPLYNITMEFYYMKIASISLEGYINPLLNHKKTDSDSWHKVSGLSLEHRFWLGKPERFKGLYLGLYGAFGGFDITDPLESSEGNTGNYVGGGLSIGFALPLSKRLLIEVGARGGYKREKSSSYMVIDNSCYQTGSGSKGGFVLQDYNISLVYRLIGKNKGREQ